MSSESFCNGRNESALLRALLASVDYAGKKTLAITHFQSNRDYREESDENLVKIQFKNFRPWNFLFSFFGAAFIYSLKLRDELKVGTSTINRDVYRIIVFYSRK